MEKLLVLDYETRSEAELKKVGGWEYSVHPTTRIMCGAWRWSTREKLRETPTEIWSPAFEKKPPPQLVQAFKCPNTKIWAHNALFEQCMTNNTFRRLYPGLFDHIPVSRWGCTAALSAASGLPRKLEQVLLALGLPVQKDMVGHKLMLKYCKPRKPTKKNPAKWHSNKDELRRIMEYCKIDVDGAVELILDLPDLSPFERALWELDQEMNQTGFLCDRELVRKVLSLLNQEAETLKLETQEITMGALASALQRDGVLNWLETEGVALPDLKKLTVEEALKNEKIDGDARRILEIRQTVSKTSTKKYQSFLARSESDNRVRDILLFNAAVPTARWGGSGVQVQNFPRGVAGIDADHAVELLQDGDYDTLKLLYGDIFSVAATCLRGMITAPKGYKLVAGDYAQIEARVLFWLAGHDLGVKAFREGRPIYEEQAQVIYSVPNVESVTKAQRQVGKHAVLGCLAEGTLVLTHTGLKPIEKLEKEDQIWSGKIWVKHGGIVNRGPKPVIQIKSLNIESTPGHWFLTNQGWRSAVEIAFVEGTPPRQLAPFLVLGPSPVGNITKALKGVSVCAVYAALLDRLESIDCGRERHVLALAALNLLMGRKVETPKVAGILYTILGLEPDGRPASTILKSVATIPRTKTSQGMVLAELNVNSNPAALFWNSLLRCLGMTNGGSPWIELITTETMGPEILELFLREKTTKIVNTYDILDCGPAASYALEKAIAHNCGYGMGAEKFQDTCWVQGQMRIDLELAKKAVYAYRNTHRPVPKAWESMERAAMLAVQYPDKKFTVNRVTWFKKGKWLYGRLPSGRLMPYYDPSIRIVKKPKRDPGPALCYWGIDSKTKRWQIESTYGGKLVENAVQAISRDIMAAAMLRARAAGFPILFTVHDELVSVRPENDTREKEFEALMCWLPAWAEGVPVKAEVWSDYRYRK